MEVSSQLHVPAALLSEKRAPGTNRIKGCVRPERSGQDKNLLPLPEIERRFFGRPAIGK